MSAHAGKQTKTATTRTTDGPGAKAATLRRLSNSNEAEQLSRMTLSLQRKSAQSPPQGTAHGASSRIIQPSPQVSSHHDPTEREADSTAKKVMRMSLPSVAPSLPPAVTVRGVVAQAPAGSRVPAVSSRNGIGKIQAKTEGPGTIDPAIAAEIQNYCEPGAPLPAEIRKMMEPRFRADFGGVRVHSGDKAARLNRQLMARAFTVGNRIFFGKDSFRPDTAEGQELLAHELTHTIQQGAVIHRMEAVEVSHRSSNMVQRVGLGDALSFIANKANVIPGFRFLTLALGFNPISMARVERNGTALIRAMAELIPGGGHMLQALENSGVLEKAGNWVDQQVASVRSMGALIKEGIDKFLDSLSWKDIFRLEEVWNRGKSIISQAINHITAFAWGLISEIAGILKNAILLPLAKLAESTRGYDLLKAVLGFDPITGERIQPTTETLIAGFLKLIRQEEVWEKLKKANALARAWAWFKGAVKTLGEFVGSIPTLFKNALASLEWSDLVLIPRAFAKMASVFGGFIARFVEWGGNAVWNLLEIIFEVVAPGAIPYLNKAKAAFRSILQNPIGFVRNLTTVGIQGFENFAANIGTHLRNTLIEWLTGSLPGIYIPKTLEFGEIVKFLQSLLGLTWANVREKIIKLIGEPAMKRLETGFELVTRLVVEGPAAVWKQIMESLGNLKEMVIGAITEFVAVTVVKKAVAKIVSLLIPGAAFIQAIITIHDTIMVFIDKLQKIKQVVVTFMDSIMEIASGAIGSAAKKVETTLAGLLTLAVSFLAGFAGLGKIASGVAKIINEKIRKPIDKALGKVAEWVVATAKKAGLFVKETGNKLIEWWKRRISFRTKEGSGHDLYFKGSQEKSIPWVASNNPSELVARLMKWKKKAKTGEATEAMRGANEKLRNALSLEKEIRQASEAKKPEPEKSQKELTDLLAELFDIFEAKEKSEAVLAYNLRIEPVVTYSTRTLKVGSRSAMVGYQTTYEYLAPNHKQGTPPSAGEQAELFEILPTLGKVGTGKTGTETYIKGHLLNDNLGGPGEAKNLFPITSQANSDHKNKIEYDAKDLVNKRGCLVFYDVKVETREVKPIEGLETAKGEQMFSINSEFHCTLDTYLMKNEKIERRNSPKKIDIKSIYKGTPIAKESKHQRKIKREQLNKDLELLAGQSVKVKDFDEKKKP